VSSCAEIGEVCVANLIRLGLSDFLRGKLVERLREEEKKELR
jgi:hypothetical protein